MKATQFEFRFRFWIFSAIYFIGFWAPWLRYGRFAVPIGTTWLELSGELAHLMPLESATLIVTCVAIFCAALGTAFRVWGTAYIGSSIMQSGTMHARGFVAAGPYRHVRNPLYLGSALFAVGIAILMPPSGAIFFLVATVVQLWRLILREELFLQAERGEAYLTYQSRVPRLFPAIVARVARSVSCPHWGEALVAEIFSVAMTSCFAVLAWRYNATLLTQALLVCFGLSLVVRAFGMKSA
ncbi:MAG TPA: methyltransferase [Silvibacterium sp.]|nr:methyltransferase [Silvibacterium sp.]